MLIIEIMGRRYWDAILSKYIWNDSDDEDCSYYSAASRAAVSGGGRITEAWDPTGYFAIPTVPTVLPSYSNPLLSYPSGSTTTPGSGAFANVVPLTRGNPDSANVSLTMIPAMAVAAKNFIFSCFLNTGGLDPYGDQYPVLQFPYGGGGLFNVPTTVPSATYPCIFWFFVLSGAGTPVFRWTGGITTTATHTDTNSYGTLYRVTVSYTPSGGSPGSNINAPFTLIPLSGDPTFFLLAVQFPLDADSSFRIKKFSTSTLACGSGGLISPSNRTVGTYPSVFSHTPSGSLTCDLPLNLNWYITFPLERPYNSSNDPYTTGNGVVYRSGTYSQPSSCPASTTSLTGITYVPQSGGDSWGYLVATKAV